MRRYIKSISIVICVVIAIALWVWGVNDPFVGSYNANNNYLSLASKNYLRFGFIALKTLPTYITGISIPQNNEFYLHHPILFFWIVHGTILLFGNGNWVVHVASFVFGFLTMGAIYYIGKELWNKRVATIATFFAFFFPMSTFFWKFVFIEQISLFLTLLVVFAFIKYIKTRSFVWVRVVWIGTFVGMLCDWYGGYLIFPFLMMLFTRFRKETVRILPTYVSAVGIGLLLFVGILAGTGHIGDMVNAFGTRSLQSELLGLSYWWLRLPVVIFLRFIIYFTPLSIAGVILWVKVYKKGKDKLANIIVLFFAVLGLINVIFLPTASWGHGYFLYFCIPFFAYSGALFIVSIKSRVWRYCFFVLVILWSVVVTFAKVGQVRKQMWKFDVSKYIQTFVAPHTKIGVINYPGDVLQNYYFIDAVAFLGTDGEDWLQGNIYKDIHLVVFTCENLCNSKEIDFLNYATQVANIEKYSVGAQNAWFIRNDREVKQSERVNIETGTISIPAQDKTPTYKSKSFDFILQWYRKLKNIIGEVQL